MPPADTGPGDRLELPGARAIVQHLSADRGRAPAEPSSRTTAGRGLFLGAMIRHAAEQPSGCERTPPVLPVEPDFDADGRPVDGPAYRRWALVLGLEFECWRNGRNRPARVGEFARLVERFWHQVWALDENGEGFPALLCYSEYPV
jgi:hypothetical protein